MSEAPNLANDPFAALIGAEYLHPDSKLLKLCAVLENLAKPGTDRNEILRIAINLHVPALYLAAGIGERRAHKIGHDNQRGFYADAIRAKGATAELTRLKRAASSGSLKLWLKAWAATSYFTRSRIERPLTRFRVSRHKLSQVRRWISKGWLSFSAPRFTINAPPALEALPVISKELQFVQIIETDQRKIRSSDLQKQELLGKIAQAYCLLSGYEISVTYDPKQGIDKGPIIDFIREVENIYKMRSKLMIGTTSSLVRKLK